MRSSIFTLLAALCCAIGLTAQTPSQTNTRTAVYIPAFTVERMQDAQWLESSWRRISRGVKIDKVYIETHRNRRAVDEALLEKVKHFFLAQGVAVAGGLALVADEPDEFRSFCYTSDTDRAYVKQIVELTARHFDEIILDDFYFNSTKTPSDIAAKGSRSWTAYRLGLMREVTRNLVLAPARVVNPRVRVIIKYPNWYEHYQALGYDLEEEPKLFDGVYTGTETRADARNEQQLQHYQSYEIIRYLSNVAPGKNGGGWVDPFASMIDERYQEQLRDTMLARAPELTLFSWEPLLAPAPSVKTGAARLYSNGPAAVREEKNFADLAGEAIRETQKLLPKLGEPIGVAAYKPLHSSSSEDYLHNYLGMIGVPVELTPTWPEHAPMILLSADAAADATIVDKIRAQLEGGGDVMITSGLLEKLQGRGVEQIAEIYVTGRKLSADSFSNAKWSPEAAPVSGAPILLPEIHFFTNDSWGEIHAFAGERTTPLLERSSYARGKLYVLAMPDNPTELYRLPATTLDALRAKLTERLPLRLAHAPAKVALIEYGNHIGVVVNYTDSEVEAVVASNKALIVGDPKGKPSEARQSVKIPAHGYKLIEGLRGE